MNLPKIHSISKKILVALLGAFLSIFLLFHASANLCLLRHDGGAWYNAFCDFMKGNYVIKVLEIGLLASLLLHIVLALWLAITNKMARPKGYHKPQRSKTHTGSKLQVWTGILLLAGLIAHFMDFYFVKLGWVDGNLNFYEQAHEKFQIPHIAISYLIFFVVVWFHMRHGFAAIFQTFGLYNYKYGKAIEVLGIIYATVICLMFTAVVLGVYFGL
ncbi:MAG: succinate dehydrogenase cytochrome b subunit [Bacteroidales bacterium]|nr:succinate dehydrogenase cytochrome b subunit [Bacteroidales bacterium]